MKPSSKVIIVKDKCLEAEEWLRDNANNGWEVFQRNVPIGSNIYGVENEIVASMFKLKFG